MQDETLSQKRQRKKFLKVLQPCLKNDIYFIKLYDVKDFKHFDKIPIQNVYLQGAAFLQSNNSLYQAGGKLIDQLISYATHRAVYEIKYQQELKVFRKRAMLQGRMSFALSGQRERIKSGYRQIKDVQIYDRARMKWKHAAPLVYPRSRHAGVSVSGGFCYAICGVRGLMREITTQRLELGSEWQQMRFKDSFTEYIIKNARLKAVEVSEEKLMIFGRASDRDQTTNESIYINNCLQRLKKYQINSYEPFCEEETTTTSLHGQVFATGQQQKNWIYLLVSETWTPLYFCRNPFSRHPSLS